VRALLLLLLAGGCFYTTESPLPDQFGQCTVPEVESGVAAPTWYRDVEPIVVKKCQGCHSEGGIAPFALQGYSQFAALRGVIHDAVSENRMPPWQPAPCCTSYQFDRSLTDAEHDTLLRWLETGTALGDEADAMPPPQPPRSLPRVDLHAQMHEPFTPKPKVGSDEIRCFLLDHDEIDRKRYITGFDLQPGARPMVHHVIVYAVDEDEAKDLAKKDGKDGRPGWDCYGEGGELSGGKKYIGGWQPGVLPRLLPDGIGRELKAHTRIMLNVHYDTAHGSGADQSALDIMLEDHVERVEKTLPVGNPLWFAGDGMKIPAGAPDTMYWFAYDPTEALTKGRAVQMHNVMMHMHEYGSLGRVAILRRNGTTECLLNITRWDFHWMADYYFETPVVLEPGDQLYVECHWDNTAENQRIVNGEREAPRDLYWQTADEMCGAVLTYSVAVEP
jgi:hypothetical protein